jgi:hypothetical protein
MIISAPGTSLPFRRTDVVRREVAEVDGDELFALPGNHDFKKMSVSDLAGGGLIGNGSFSLFAHDVFSKSIATYHFLGEESLDGRILLRYDFQVSKLLSFYRIGTEKGTGDVGYHGSFWVDPQTFDAARLDILADGIPPRLGVDQAANRIEYALVRIGPSNALLPQVGELSLRRSNGVESRNQLTFTHCREYGVESSISFGEVGDSAVPSRATRDVELPAGLQLTISLETPIDSSNTHVGDPVSGRVAVDVKHKGKVAVHKGALVSGRMRALEQHLEDPPSVLARLEFTRIEFDGKKTRFFAELEKIIPPPGFEGIKLVAAVGLPGVGTLSILGNRMVLPAGTRMIWKTSSYEQAAARGQ